MESNLRYLAELYGIETTYSDDAAGKREVDSETVRSILASMGVTARSWNECEQRIYEFLTCRADRGISPTLTYFEDHTHLLTDITIRASDPWQQLQWEIVEEGGIQTHSGVFNREHLPLSEAFPIFNDVWHRYRLFFPVKLPIGYHQLTMTGWGGAPGGGRVSRILVAPLSCYIGRDLEEGWRHWGVRVHLAGVRSGSNWGVGDFSDLEKLIEATASLGAGALSLTPLHALDPRDVRGQNPYAPISRSALNLLYIDIPAVEEAETSAAFKEYCAGAAFQRKLKALRGAELIDYRGVLHLKLSALELLYKDFRSQHLDQGTSRADAFRAFVEQREDIRSYAVFEALKDYFEQLHVAGWGWRNWPEEYRDPASPEVAAFAEKYVDRIGLHQYIQWLADQQLQKAAALARRVGLSIALCLDLALSARPNSAESWAFQAVLAPRVFIGHPPNAANPTGVNLRLCCWNPLLLQETFFESFIHTLRQTLRHAGAIRLPMLEQAARLYWVPEGARPSQGAFVRYPIRDLAAILAIESHRSRCIIIGEGGAGDAKPGHLDERRVLVHRVHFMEQRHGEFLQSWDYPKLSLVTAIGQDTPTIKGFWEGSDIVARRELGLLNPLEWQEQQTRRTQEREALVRALRKEGVILPRKKTVQVRDVNLGVHRLLARSPALLQFAALEDMLEQETAHYMPGTLEERPNWCIRTSASLEELADHAAVKAVAAAIRNEGRR